MTPPRSVAVVGLVLYGLFFGWPIATGSSAEFAVALAATAIVVAGLCLHRRAPLLVFVVLVALTCVRSTMGWSEDPFLAAAFVLYTIVVARPAPTVTGTRLALAFWAGSVGLLGVVGVDPPGARRFAWGILVLATAGVLGVVVADRARQRRRVEEESARSAVLAERLRIAREVHDVVSHALGGIRAQAAVAEYVPDLDAVALRDTLGRIATTSRVALDDLRDLLGVVRDEEGIRDRTRASLDRIPDLVAATGLDCVVECDPPDSPAEEVAAATFRIVQESLTNVTRHAPGASCRVTVRAEAAWLVTTVHNAAPPPPPRSETGSATGHGLVGMRERAATLGGVVEAGPDSEGGFLVRARLPLRPGGPP